MRGFDVYGVDPNESAIKMLRMQAKKLQPERFVISTLEEMIFPPDVFDYIISSAVLHFARDHDHFDTMLSAMTKVLKPGGILFIRMTTSVGLEDHIDKTDSGVHKLPDGSERYVLNIDRLDQILEKHALRLTEPLKSVVVHEQRSMGVFVLQKI